MREIERKRDREREKKRKVEFSHETGPPWCWQRKDVYQLSDWPIAYCEELLFSCLRGGTAPFQIREMKKKRIEKVLTPREQKVEQHQRDTTVNRDAALTVIEIRDWLETLFLG